MAKKRDTYAIFRARKLITASGSSQTIQNSSKITCVVVAERAKNAASFPTSFMRHETTPERRICAASALHRAPPYSRNTLDKMADSGQSAASRTAFVRALVRPPCLFALVVSRQSDVIEFDRLFDRAVSATLSLARSRSRRPWALLQRRGSPFYVFGTVTGRVTRVRACVRAAVRAVRCGASAHRPKGTQV